MRRVGVAVVAVLLVAAGCSSSGSEGGADTGGSGGRPGGSVRAPAKGACDDIDPSECLFPWPNDRFTRYDASTPTKRRLDLPASGMPENDRGVGIDPAEWNRNDGFAPASILMARFDDLDVAASKLPPVTDLASSLDEDSGLLLVDGRTGERVAAWAELDANADDEARQALLINPAAALTEGHTYHVGLRGLRRTDGEAVRPSKGFARQLSHPDAMAARTFEVLERQPGVARRDLDLAWSFTVGSAQSISGRLRHMWTETRTALGDGAPRFRVTSNEEQGSARLVQGTFDVPKYLTGDGGPGSVMNNADDPDGIPDARGSMRSDFLCLVPKGATAAKPAATVIYGHGLLGSRTEALDIGMVGASVNLSFCALDFIGMSTADVPAVASSFEDLTAFRALPDRLQQGHLAFLLLGRLLRSREGFASDPAFQDGSGKPVIDTGSTSLLGASQGGILGGVSSALTEDWQQVVLAVPGMAYNLLLRRSVDFDEFAPIVEQHYPDELDQALLLDLLEQLWQRGENAGYAQHLLDHPYPGVPAKHVLLLEAFGDHQVANVSTEKLARTLAIGRRAPTLADGRSSDDEPFWGIDEESLPSKGSALVVWDFGTPTPPVENLPNRAGEDPHGKLAEVPEALALVLGFVRDGEITDVCGEGPCQSPG